MPPREKEDAISVEKYNSHAVNFESPAAANEKAWIFEDALKLIGELCQNISKVIRITFTIYYRFRLRAVLLHVSIWLNPARSHK